MIHVTIYRNEKREYIGFRTNGHAGYREEGQDIVCAAASMLVINTINAIELYTKDETSMVSDDISGIIEYEIKDRPSKEVQLLMKTLVLGLKQMADDENYAEYIDLTFEEV